ncbi:sensor domain-containing protein [Thermocatellispora tengchongensis]|uniref:sensor domain-containing protein n=1 Tax=Thermocatellispora tengchongensis TaxID=1073253 RepID=UPI00363A6D82
MAAGNGRALRHLPLRRPGRWDLGARGRATLDALEHLVGGMSTGVLALVVLMAVAVTALACLVGVGVKMGPAVLRGLRAVADRERDRLSRWGTEEIIAPPPPPAGLRAALADPTVRRELAWVVAHGSAGLLLGLVALTLPVHAVQDATFALWWWLLPRRRPRPRPTGCGRSGTRPALSPSPPWPRSTSLSPCSWRPGWPGCRHGSAGASFGPAPTSI